MRGIVGKARRAHTSIHMVIHLGANTSMRAIGKLCLYGVISGTPLPDFMLSEIIISISIGLVCSPATGVKAFDDLLIFIMSPSNVEMEKARTGGK